MSETISVYSPDARNPMMITSPARTNIAVYVTMFELLTVQLPSCVTK